MSELPTNGQKARRPPTCPGCRTELARFNDLTVTFPSGIVAHMFYCPNDDCRQLLAMQIVGQVAKEPLIVPGSAMPPTPIRQ